MLHTSFPCQMTVSSKVLLVTFDIVILSLTCLIPTISHLFAFPFYKLSPMLFLFILGMAVTPHKYNAVVLALLMPWLSYAVVGMPTLTKALCMSAELATVAVVFPCLAKQISSFPAVLCSILLSKVVYYGIKMVMVGSLVIETSVGIQLLVSLSAAMLFVAVRGVVSGDSKKNRHLL